MAIVTEIEIYKGFRITHEKNEYRNKVGKTAGLIRVYTPQGDYSNWFQICTRWKPFVYEDVFNAAIDRAKKYIDNSKKDNHG